jgi:ABC-type multidrug transport system ATPase subunit
MAERCRPEWRRFLRRSVWVGRQNDQVAKFSGGMKQRRNIGVALLHKSPSDHMDEPTVGIDPQSGRNILDGVKALNEHGRTILYTTHYTEEAQELSDHIAIMDQGEGIASAKVMGSLSDGMLQMGIEPGFMITNPVVWLTNR